jgi:tape measure domain-containing protein
MASVAALNVRIGGDIKQLEKALKDAERAVKKSGAQLSAIGNDLSLKLSLPMAAFGAASLKAAGDIEALNKSMIAIFAGSGRSVEEARMEVDALRKSAEAPGLDFEQAVKASIRLQGVGQSAEKARNTVEQLANAVATTGGTAEDLGEVVNQFSQMIGKGKILNEDIKIITGRMPVLAGLMKDAFGSTQAEDIRATGITAAEFVDTLVKGMGKMTRVEGGISNAIVNAGTSIKMFLASVGESLNKTFNITGKLESFAKWLDGMAQAFAGMSDGTRTAVAGVAVFVLALGPMVKVGQFAILAYGQLVAVFGALQKVLLQSLAGQAIPGVIAGFKALDAATRLTIVGAAIGVVLALAAAFVTLSSSQSEAVKTAQMVEGVRAQALANTSEQRLEVDRLVKSLDNNVLSMEGQEAILNKLNTISPEYFGEVKAGATAHLQAAEAAKKFNSELIRTAIIEAAKDKIKLLADSLLNFEEMSDVSAWQTIGNALKSLGSGAAFAGFQAKDAAANWGENNTKVRGQMAALENLIKVQEDAKVSGDKQNEGAKKSTNSIASLTEKVSELTEKYNSATIGSKEYYSLKGQLKTATEALEKATGKEKKAVDALAKSYKDLDASARRDQRTKDTEQAKRDRERAPSPTIPTNKTPFVTQQNPGSPDTPKDVETEKTIAQEKAEAAAKAVKNLQDVVDAFKKGTASFSEVWDAASVSLHLSIERLSLSFQNLGKVMKVALFDAAAAAQDYAEKGGASFREMGKAALAGGAKVVRSYIMQGVAAAVSKALTSVPFPFNVIAGGIAGAAAGTLFNKLLNSLKIPAMAMGGTAKGGLTLVGELGPELVNLPRGSVVTPNNRLSSMMGGGQTVILTPSIHYDASGFRIMMEKEYRRNNRQNG